MNINLQEIYESIKSSIKTDYKDILETANNTKPSYLDKNTLYKEKNDALSSIKTITDGKKNEIIIKLRDYRFVDEINELHRGKYVRWIRKIDENCIVKVGGVVVDIKILNTGTHVLVFNKYVSKSPIQYKFDDVLTFQKLSVDDLLILFAQSMEL